MTTTAVLLCRCADAGVIDAGAVAALEAALLGSDVPFYIVDDLCGRVARHDPLLATIAAADDIRIAACRPRAVRALFATAGHPLPATGVQCVDLRATDLAQATAILTAPGGEAPAQPPAPSARDIPRDWSAWFPAIDQERCTACGQCHNFCVFGVYARDDDGRVRVQRPENCKIDCPACARVCPRLAIVFPRHGERPIDGDEIGPDDHGIDLDELVGGDICTLLRQRSRATGGLRPAFSHALDDQDAVDPDCPCMDDPVELLRRLGVPDAVIARDGGALARQVEQREPTDDQQTG
ncbi:MAG: ATP-binding protein [Planctomycetota bacterium]